MNKYIDKRIMVTVSLACFLLLYVVVVLYTIGSIRGERNKNSDLQKKFSEAVEAKEEMGARLKEAETLAIDIKARLKTQEETIADSAKSLEEAKTEAGQALSRLQARDKEMAAMQQSLDEASAEIQGMRLKLDKANSDYLGVKGQLDAILKAKEDAENKARDVSEREGTSLGTIVVAK